MRYVGGKQRIAKRIAEVILSGSPDADTYVEPFVGGGAVGAVLGSRFDHAAYSDSQEDLILMWDALNRGEYFPEAITREEWEDLRGGPPSPLRGLAGFGGSFSGKWFSGYAKGGFQSDGTPRNHYGESLRRARKDIVGMRGRISTSFTCQSYSNIVGAPGTVIYADPPYEGTYNYGVSFDHREFWATAGRWSFEGSDVYVSEYAAPEWAEVVLEAEIRVSSKTTAQGRNLVTERLFKVPAL